MSDTNFIWWEVILSEKNLEEASHDVIFKNLKTECHESYKSAISEETRSLTSFFKKVFWMTQNLIFTVFSAEKYPFLFKMANCRNFSSNFRFWLNTFFRMPHWKANSWSLKRWQRSLQAALICYICCQNRNTTHFWH